MVLDLQTHPLHLICLQQTCRLLCILDYLLPCFHRLCVQFSNSNPTPESHLRVFLEIISQYHLLIDILAKHSQRFICCKCNSPMLGWAYWRILGSWRQHPYEVQWLLLRVLSFPNLSYCFTQNSVFQPPLCFWLHLFLRLFHALTEL